MKTLPILIFFFIVNCSFAQFSYGPRLGLNLNPQPQNSVSGTTYLNSFNGGFVGRYQINNWFSVKSELNYNTKRKTYSFDKKQSLLSDLNAILDGVVDTSLLNSFGDFINDTVYSFYKGSDVLRFIELPVMGFINYKNFELGAGFYLGYLHKANSKEELKQESALLDIILPAIDSIQFVGPLLTNILTSSYPGYKSASTTESSLKTPFKNFDYGFITELTYHSSDKLFFSVRYSRGFNNYRINPLRSNDVYNTFTLSLGYSFGSTFNSKPKGIYDLDKIPVENNK
jgi:hypothetical protein